jgi:outer membrane receptor protein involved in Fe transport
MKTRAFVLLGTLAVFVVLGIMGAPEASAQAVYGSIFGTITDPSGAAVAGAKVTVTSATKGTTFDATTNSDGNYSVTHLIPDLYNIRAEGSGFKAFESKNISVSADAGSRVDGQFQVGGSTETVEVTSEAPQLTTDRADVATTFNDKYVQDVPILNRNFTNLQLMAPGSQKMVGWSHAATENPQGSLQIFTQGQHFSGTAFELDGTDNQDPILGIIVVNPNLDAVTEAKVSLQNYDAEFGKAVSSVVTAQTKSGSNQLHGSGFLFRRSDAQQARDPFTQFAADKITHRFIPPSRWVQFGGTVGGAIIKDKLFFFGDYQGTRQTNGVSGTFTVPTARVKSSCNPATNATSATPGFCDLSEYSAPAAGITGGGVVFDPLTGNLNTGVGRTAFPGNLIPIKRISPAAGKILAAFPDPQSGGVLNNLIGSGSGPFTQNSFDTRIDYAASSSINVFGRFSLDYFKLSGKGLLGAVGGPGNGLLGLAGSSITHNYSLASGFTKTLSSSLLTDFRFGYFKYNPQTQKPDVGTPMSDFGIPNANTSDPKTAGLGAFLLGTDPISGQDCTINNGKQGCVISSFGDGLGVARCNCPLTESEQQFQFVNNWTKLKGNHQIKFGGDIRYAMNLRIPSDNNRTGEYNFSPEATSNGGAGGLDLGSLLLGQVTSFARYVNNPNLPGANNAAERQKRWFFYGQDTWRVTPKLTLNYGLRWEIYFPETVNAKGNGGFANIIDLGGTGAIRVAGFGKIGANGNVDNTYTAFAPRLGIAYQITPKTVVRLGYGRSYDIGVFGSNFGHTVTQNLPVLLKQSVDATAFNPLAAGSKVPVFLLDNGPIAATFPAVPDDGIIPFSSLGGQVSGTHIRPTKQVLPLVDSWNATVQHQLTNTVSVEVAYVGSKGTHGFAGDGPNYDANPPSLVNFNAINPVTGVTFTQNQRRPLCGPEDALGNCTKIPFGLGNFYGNDASSSYKAFEAKIEKRFNNGLQFVSHYTFSHADGYDSNYYAISHPIAYGPVDFNRNHVFVFNTVYELPFGKGKKYMGNSSRAMDYAVGGWQLANTTNWSSGLPWTPSFAECGPEEDVGICRPNKGTGTLHTGAGSLDPVSHTITYFTPVANIVTNPGVFADPGAANLGNLGRNTYHGPGGFYSDLSAVKKFRVTERLSAQFRVDAFNVFNHPVYAFSQNNGANGCIDCQGGNNGKITALESGTTMRQLQFAIRFDF